MLWGMSHDRREATRDALAAPGTIYDKDGNFLIGDSGNNRIRRMDAFTRVVETVAGSGDPGPSGATGRGGNTWAAGGGRSGMP